MPSLSGDAHDQQPLLDTLRATSAEAVSLIEGIPDRVAAFDAATRLAECLRELSDEAFELRPEIATEILEHEHLSLTALAKRIGISKARANQMVQHVRTKRGDHL